MPSDFNIPLSMPSWNEQVTARPQAGLLSQQAELRKRKMLQLQAELAAAAATPPSFSYEQLSDGIPPVENFAPPPAQNLIQQPQHIGGSTTGLIGGPPPIDKRMTFTKPFPQQVGADSYEHRMGVTQQPGLLVDQSNNAGLVGRPQPMPQPTLSDFQSGMTPADTQKRLAYEPQVGVRPMTEPPQGLPSHRDNIDSALSRHFANNPEMQSVLMSQFQHENNSLDPKAVERIGTGSSTRHLGVGLMQFTDMPTDSRGREYPVDEDGRKNGEHQQRAFIAWLADNGRDMDADSTVEYIRELITADSVWAKKYHNIGAGNRRKGRALLDPNRQGGRATVRELSDFMTEHVVGPGTRGSATRRTASTQRRSEAQAIHNSRQSATPSGL